MLFLSVISLFIVAHKKKDVVFRRFNHNVCIIDGLFERIFICPVALSFKSHITLSY